MISPATQNKCEPEKNTLQDFDIRSLFRVVSREFDDVLAFLERFQIGPAMDEEPVLQPDLRTRLERFADGHAGPQEREEICEILRVNPALVRWVADRVKKKREE